MYSERKLRTLKKREILQALTELCKDLNSETPSGSTLPELEFWPKTRQIADRCDASIYVTRAILLQLEEEGKVIKSPQLYYNSLRWFIKKAHS